MFVHNLSPIVVEFFGLEIRWYGVMYAVAFIFAYFLLPYFAKMRKLNISRDELHTFLIYLFVVGLSGARIVYIIANELSYYLKNPFEMIAIWHGGLAFHGALLTGIPFAYWYCKKKKINFYDFADICVAPLALGQALGRIGNFINAEVVGTTTNLPWGVKYATTKYEGFRHPYALYASLKNFANFALLWFLNTKNLSRGIVFWSYLAFYSGVRFSIEFMRIMPHYFGLTLTQWASIPLFFVSIYYLFRSKH